MSSLKFPFDNLKVNLKPAARQKQAKIPAMDENNWNLARCSGNRPKRSDSSRTGGGSPRTRSARITPINISRSPTYIDDVTLNAMITSGMMETLGPVNIAQFRVPLRPNNMYPSQHDTFGSQIDYNLNWMPKTINLSDQSQGRGAISSRFKKFQQNTKDIQLLEDEDEPPRKDPRFLLQQLDMEESASAHVAHEKKETILQWFDRSVEKELKKRKEATGHGQSFQDVLPGQQDLNISKTLMEKISEASASRIEIAAQMEMVPDTELTDAVDKFAKAEAMCSFAGAVKAAEAAAEAAPPEFAEEAAVASARVFQTEVTTTGVVKEELPGIRPMEIVGYIGVTKPKVPMKQK